MQRHVKWLVTMVLLVPTLAKACSCAVPPLQVLFDQSDLVVVAWQLPNPEAKKRNWPDVPTPLNIERVVMKTVVVAAAEGRGLRLDPGYTVKVMNTGSIHCQPFYPFIERPSDGSRLVFLRARDLQAAEFELVNSCHAATPPVVNGRVKFPSTRGSEWIEIDSLSRKK